MCDAGQMDTDAQDEIEEEDREAIADLFSDLQYEYRHDGRGLTVWDGIVRDPFPLCEEMVLGFPNRTHEVCRGSCDLPESELQSVFKNLSQGNRSSAAW